MGRFVILLLCLAYSSWPQGCMGSGLGVSGGTSGSGLGEIVKEFNEKKKRERLWFSMKCPNGESFSVREGENSKEVLASMKYKCERRPPYCPYDLDNPNLACSAAEGLLKEFDLEPACIIHDLCYLQFGDTDKRRCDNDFHHNMKELCSHPWWTYLPFKFGIPLPVAAVTNCASVPGVAYEAVKNHGNSNTSTHKNSKERKCRKNPPTPVNGSWGSWSSWSSCDRTCGSGTRSRRRNCNGQKNGGKYCNGSSSESKTCSNSRSCSESSGGSGSSKEWYEERDWSNFGGGFL